MYVYELEIAIKAAKLAGEVIEKYQSKGFEVEFKSKDNPVTLADKEADDIIKKTILEKFPEDGWLSEETSDNEERLSKSRVWIVDPLDGTKEFVKNIPEYAVSIALVENNISVVGVIYYPSLGILYKAFKKGGAFLDETKIKVDDFSLSSKTKILASRSELSRGEWEPFQDKMLVTPAGGMAHKMAEVAAGKASGSFTLKPKNEWDFAAGILIIEEAGGKVIHLDGSDILLNQSNPLIPGLIFGNQKVVSDLLNLI